MHPNRRLQPRHAAASMRALAQHHGRLAVAWLAAATRFEAAEVPELAVACRQLAEAQRTLARALTLGDLSEAVTAREQGSRLMSNGKYLRLVRCLEGFAEAEDRAVAATARILLGEESRSLTPGPGP